MRVLPAILAAAALAGCAATGTVQCERGETPAVSDFLYFGTQMAEGRVGAADWAAFLADTVTPRFSEGLTAWPAAGQWKAGDGRLVREDSFVLSLVHRDDERTESRVREVIAAYKARFRQESVLRVKSVACVTY